METMTRIERKKLAARQRILEAAEKLFLRDDDGYDKTTIRDIAQLADVSTGAVYIHFAGKPDIMAVLLDQILDAFLKNFHEVISTTKTGIQKISDYINQFFALLREPRFLSYLHYIVTIKPEEIESHLTDSLKQRGRKVFELLRDAVAAGHEDRSIRKLASPDLTAFIIQIILKSFHWVVALKAPVDIQCEFPGFSQKAALKLLKTLLLLGMGGETPAKTFSAEALCKTGKAIVKKSRLPRGKNHEKQNEKKQKNY
jgi:AcrR family transcriptional regulator